MHYRAEEWEREILTFGVHGHAGRYSSSHGLRGNSYRVIKGIRLHYHAGAWERENYLAGEVSKLQCITEETCQQRMAFLDGLFNET